jgi:hypothetical protein
MANYKDGVIKPARLECEQWGGSPRVVFEGHPSITNGTVKIIVGDASALVTRRELAAAAALFAEEEKTTLKDVVEAVSGLDRTVSDLHDLTDRRTR